MKIKTVMIFSLLIFILILGGSPLAQNKSNEKSVLTKNTTGEPNATRFNINNISTVIYDNGRMDVNGPNAAFEYPKNSDLYAVYSSGFLWSGLVNNEIIVGGIMYGSNNTPGKILEDGSPQDRNNSNVHIYRVRPDYEDCDLLWETIDENKTEDEVRLQYLKDWYDWPAEDGAPFEDVDHNGVYNSDIDIPGIEGADQTIWMVVNNLDDWRSDAAWGSEGFGMEIQITVWGYKESDILDNVYFKKYRLINKDNRQIDSMYVGLFSDPDIGYLPNDLTGCDTLLNLGYCYNGEEFDHDYGSTPPAVGNMLLQGPIVEANPSDTAFNFGLLSFGKRNLNFSSFAVDFIPTANIDWYWEPHNIYNILHSKNWGLEHQIPEEFGGGTTNFPFSGNPVTGEGYLDVFDAVRIDNYFMLNSGPFNMAPGDTQVVVYAEFAAGAKPEVDRLEAVTLLKEYSNKINKFYRNNFSATLISPPDVESCNSENEIIIYWHGDEVEYLNDDYNFQGYNVYQLQSANSLIEDGLKIASFDLDDDIIMYSCESFDWETQYWGINNISFGTDKGIERYLLISKDYFTNNILYNDSEYHFAVSSFAIDPNAFGRSRIIESNPLYITAVPQAPAPGIIYSSEHGDVSDVIHNSGASSGYIEVTIIDPTIQTGNDYEITFFDNGQLVWDLTNVSKDSLLLSGQTNLNGGDQYYITDGFVVKVYDDAENPLTVNDKFSFITPTVTYDEETAILDTEEINVFPNPYYGQHNNELNYYESFVTFNHLPERAVIKIFNLAGQHVRSLEKNDNSQYLRWDLMNDHQFLVGSGIYIAYIELPVLGKVKILKLAVIQQNKIPSWY